MARVYCDNRKGLSCRTCEIACAVRHSKSHDVYEMTAEEPRPKRLVKVKSSQLGPLPLRCHHCEVAACIDASTKHLLYFTLVQDNPGAEIAKRKALL